MDNFFLLLLLVSFVAILIYMYKYIRLVKSDKQLAKQKLQRAGISLGVLVVSFIGLGMTTDPVEQQKEETVAAAKTEKPDEKAATEKKLAAEKATKEKKAAEEKAKADAEKKAKEEEEKKAAKLAKKESYVNDVKPQMDSVMKEYDRLWDEQWKPTFEGLGTTVDLYTAYDNMKMLEVNYSVLEDQINEISTGELSGDNKKQLDEFKTNLSNAANARGLAANHAQKMFDSGDYSPSNMDELQSIVSLSDSHMFSAAINLTQLNMTFEVE